MTIADNIIPRLFTHPTWMTGSPCDGQTELFFADSKSTKHVEQARAICHTCPHRIRCLEYAIDNAEQFGVWGGMSVRERRAVGARRRQMGWTTGRNRNVARGVA